MLGKANFLRRAIRALDHLKLQVSQVLIPPGQPAVRQISVMGKQLLVLANEDVGRYINVLGNYEDTDATYLRKVIRPTDICFDIGANIGYFSLLMALAAYRGTVYAFEPLPLNFHLIAATAEVNRLPIVASCCAVSDVDGDVSFSESIDSAYSSLIATGRKPELRKISVPAVTLAGFCKQHEIKRIDVMKIDVEGAEERVIRGGLQILSDPRAAPRLVMVELYDGNLAAFGTSISRVVEVLKGLGYSAIVPLSEGLTEAYNLSHYNRVVNVFFVRDGIEGIS